MIRTGIVSLPMTASGLIMEGTVSLLKAEKRVESKVHIRTCGDLVAQGYAISGPY